MAYVTGLLLIDAPASALNNGTADDNKVGRVKRIRTAGGDYPYVSAQSFRFWLRTTLAQTQGAAWRSPVFKESDNLAYPDGNPIEYCDDDVFGYMRAPSSQEGREHGTGMQSAAKKAKKTAKSENEAGVEPAAATEGKGEKPTLTRISPFRVGTLVAVAPSEPTVDFGSMTRHEEGNPVLHRHDFYRAHLQGLFSFDLTSVGTFYHANKVGCRNLDAIRTKLAQDRGLESVKVRNQDAFRLPASERQARAATVIRAMAQLDGGAKQALHYTDVAPSIVIAAITRGGNHPFSHVFGPGPRNSTQFHAKAFSESLQVFQSELLSPIFVGWSHGFLDSQREVFEKLQTELPSSGPSIIVEHPKVALTRLSEELTKNVDWFN